MKFYDDNLNQYKVRTAMQIGRYLSECLKLVPDIAKNRDDTVTVTYMFNRNTLLSYTADNDTVLSCDYHQGLIYHGRSWCNGERNRYDQIVSLDDRCGASGLCMHTQTYGRHAFAAITDKACRYAFVLLSDGGMVDGSFTLFSDGRFSVS